MQPLQITAHLAGPVCLPHGSPAIDGLLAWAVSAREHLPPPVDASDCAPIEIPIQREPGGRFHLASFGVYEVEKHEHRWLNRRFPIAEAQAMGNAKLRRINLAGGPCKSYRLPLETLWLVDDRIDWWCIGEREEIEALLALVGYVGKKRATGLGHVRRWSVEPCDPWGEGFPVLRDGVPTRPLPLDWPGLTHFDVASRVASYPYWDHTKEEPCAIPL